MPRSEVYWLHGAWACDWTSVFDQLSELYFKFGRSRVTANRHNDTENRERCAADAIIFSGHRRTIPRVSKPNALVEQGNSTDLGSVVKYQVASVKNRARPSHEKYSSRLEDRS